MEEQVNEKVNPEYKDRLFKFIFGKETEQSKRWRLQLYNALLEFTEISHQKSSRNNQ